MSLRPDSAQAPLTARSYPKFHPHITLASLPLGMEVDLDNVERSIPKIEEPLACQFAAVETGSHYYRSVYIRIKLSAELVSLHKHIHDALQVEPRTPAFPHLSLCYIDDIDAADGERYRYYNALQKAGRIQHSPGNFESEGISLFCGGHGEGDWLGRIIAREIWVVRCEGAVDSWVVLKKINVSQDGDGM
ncbi:hypothetical protein HYPSUDRAFT_131664 [Hypholoma sublateritium FD-334 SS-4]|uniref:Uncharacterized protein n=1 Tax=Hypholoma sublateritium (strain FD-334 SS-4) TaxID=945553 RepID=A0A0D2PEZ6_HYPSF|nr:hypothetical protein HYPSUDRAFT_131664 [Hypholoma sublateritium FD-334 SS-4]